MTLEKIENNAQIYQEIINKKIETLTTWLENETLEIEWESLIKS